jgi:plastocyanin
MKRIRLLLAALPLALLVACGETPERTQKARGLLSGVNLIAGLTVIVLVVAVAFIVGAIALDRFVTTKNRLAVASGAPPVEEEEDEIVAGITVGRARVPRWLYACYVLIPLFAISYVFSNVSIRPETPPEKTKGPETGPKTDVDIVAAGIKFNLTEMTVAAGKQITVNAENNDSGVPHTFTVWKSEADATANKDKVADTGQFGSGTKKVTFTAPAAGTTWFFNCTIHPAMKGDIKAAEGAAGGESSGSSTSATLVAAAVKFDKSKLNFKANSDIKVEIDNKDAGVPHTFTVWKTEADATANKNKVADTGSFSGKKTLSFKTGPPGEWFFNCTIHPAMKGTITIT